MGRVEDVGPLAMQHPRHVDLFADRIGRRRLEHRPEVGSELAANREIGLVAEEDVFALTIDAGQMTQQIARVRPDAEIVELARVDRDPHCYWTVVMNPRYLPAIILVSLGRQAIAQGQIRAEEWQPAWVVFLVEGELTTTVRHFRRAR